MNSELRTQQPPDSKTPVLDHGYIQLIESWGSDRRIIEAARMSSNKGFLGWGTQYDCSHGSLAMPCSLGCLSKERSGDEKLLKFLYDNWHDTPFEMAGIIIEVQAPIFVFREWHRHRTQSYNEMSARYTPLPDFNYVPTSERCIQVNSPNKQANGHRTRPGELTHQEVLDWIERLQEAYAFSQVVYKEGLDLGIPKEVARLPVPVARYSRMRASANLRNWLAFLTLRSDKNPNAQWEIRQFANEVAGLVQHAFPRTYNLFVQGRK